MTTQSQSMQHRWTATEAQSATFVELFFDLVFVFAVTSITSFLLDNLSLTGVGRGAIILWLIWWAWTQFTWTLNPADTNHPAVRVITLAATAVAYFMAQAIPDAFNSAGIWFAVAYVIVRALGLGLQIGVASRTQESASTVVAWIAGSSVGLLLVLAGGVLDSPWREALWTAAIIADFISAARAGRGRWELYPEHFAERHGLIVIIALGESLIASGVALKGVPRDGTFAIGTVAMVIAICALWWLYFGHARDRMEHYLASRTSDQIGAAARNIYSWGHLPIIAGIIALAVGLEKILAHSHDPLATSAMVALVAGVVFYMGGIAYGLRISGERSIIPWIVAAAAAIAAVVLGAAWGLASLLVLTGVLVVFAVWHFWSSHRTREHSVH